MRPCRLCSHRQGFPAYFLAHFSPPYIFIFPRRGLSCYPSSRNAWGMYFRWGPAASVQNRPWLFKPGPPWQQKTSLTQSLLFFASSQPKARTFNSSASSSENSQPPSSVPARPSAFGCHRNAAPQRLGAHFLFNPCWIAVPSTFVNL